MRELDWRYFLVVRVRVGAFGWSDRDVKGLEGWDGLNCL
jgi:hypothetical protein